MNKPKILKGGVKEFIETVKFETLDELPPHRNAPAIEIMHQNFKLYLFYSQPFKPEMIQYFDFWKANYWDRIKFDFDEDNKFTLSQFITNCTQAGIKLTWKE